jgi:hypothetical protein
MDPLASSLLFKRTALLAFKLAGDEAGGPHSQCLYDPAMEESYGISDQIHRISH